MTIAAATEYTEFVTNRALRAHVVAALVSGRSAVCPDCTNIFSPETGCSRCDAAKFDAMAADYDAQEADRDAFLYDTPAFALTPTADAEAAFDKMIEQRNFWGSPFDC